VTQTAVSGKRTVVYLLAGVIVFAGVLAALVKFAATGGKPAKKRTKPKVTLTDPPAHWWMQEAPCPIGASLKNTEQPKTYWCELPSKMKHGYYTRWHTEQLKAERGSYNHGKRTHLWTTWHSNGKPASRAGYLDGERLTDHVHWNAKGEVLKILPAPEPSKTK